MLSYLYLITLKSLTLPTIPVVTIYEKLVELPHMHKYTMLVLYLVQAHQTDLKEDYCKSLIFSEFRVFDLNAKLKGR